MQIPPGFIAIFARYTNAVGHQCENVMGYSVDPGFSQTEADAISDWIAPSYKTWLSTSSDFLGVHVLVGSDGEPGAFDSASSAGSGTAGGALVTPQVQSLIKKLSAAAGRHGRGRMYLPDIHDDQVNDSGGLDSTAIGNMDDIATQWMTLTDADAILLAPMILHNDSTDPTEITAMVSELKVATQRRRYPR